MTLYASALPMFLTDAFIVMFIFSTGEDVLNEISLWVISKSMGFNLVSVTFTFVTLGFGNIKAVAFPSYV